ncbi:MAG: SDR family oxidoreductase [Thermoproteota archaeon]|nr:SDR family oxidoreductase [Thermoproteota archaeon]
MAIDSDKRVAIVTGVCKSIGQTIALEFAKEGYCLAINGTDKSAMDNASKNIRKAFSGKDDAPSLISVEGDTSHEEVAKSLVEQTVSRYGRIDVLINNLELVDGPYRVNSTNNIETEKPLSPYFTLEEFEFPDNSVRGGYICTREVVKWMTKTPRSVNNNHSIVNVSYCPECVPPSKDAFTSSRSGVDLYTSSRETTRSLTKTAALELARVGIRVNGIIPGIISSDETEQDRNRSANNNWQEEVIPIKRIGQPKEVAQVATFLASPKASYVTGTVVYVDGGLALNRPGRFLEQDLVTD